MYSTHIYSHLSKETMHKYTSAKVLLLLMLLLVAGCDSNKEDEQQTTASYEITITGADTQTITGNQAAFGAATDPQTGITGFSMTIGASTETNNLITFIRKGGRPSTGTHAIADVDDDTDFDTLGNNDIFAIYSNGMDIFYSSGGSLTLTKSTDTRVEGTLNMTAQSVINDSTGVSLVGSFIAVGFDISG